MPKCPYCDENIEFVVYSYMTVGYKQIMSNGREKEWYPDDKFPGDTCQDCDRGLCQCPKCGMEIFSDDDVAREFLKDKKNRRARGKINK